MFCLFFPFTPVFTISSEFKKKKSSLKQSSKCDKKKPQEKKNLKLINKLSETWRHYCILTMSLRMLKKKTNDKNVLTNVNIITFSQVTTYLPAFPFHRSFCHMTGFLKLGLFDGTKFYFITQRFLKTLSEL